MCGSETESGAWRMAEIDYFRKIRYTGISLENECTQKAQKCITVGIRHKRRTYYEKNCTRHQEWTI